MRIMFVDDHMEEIESLWKHSGCDISHELLLPLESFMSVERTYELVSRQQPDVVFIGFGLGAWPITGADVVRFLRNHGYQGLIIGNSGGGVFQFESEGIVLDGSVNRNPDRLKTILPHHLNSGPPTR